MKKILKLVPVFKDYIWGGEKLKSDFNKKADFDKIAESWELCCHKNGTNLIEGENVLLSEYIDRNPDVLGTNAEKFSDFPVLIKLIDAKDNLSVQVHPSDEYALKFESSFGKTEMWYVVDASQDSYLYYGFNREITKDEFKDRIENNTLLEVLNKVQIKKGDSFFIESGTIHAICKDTLIAEIQQNSDITYRVYDYGRVGKDGKPRDLHISKAMDVACLKLPNNNKLFEAEEMQGYKYHILSECKYFKTYKYDITERCELLADNTSFHSVLCLAGNAIVNGNVSLKKGDSIFIPAGFGRYLLEGKCEIINTKI